MIHCNKNEFAERLLFWVICLTVAGLFFPSNADAVDQPNYVLIFVDDLGYGDIGPFGSDRIETPNLDRMAKEGMKFTSFYATSGVCTPSRASLMTGSYPRRVGMHVDDDGRWVLFPGAKKGLHPREVTIAEVLKKEDYATMCIGKWHLGDQPEFLPTRQGFDHYFGIPYSNDMGAKARPNDNFPPLPLLRDETVIETEPDMSAITGRYTEEAVQFIRDHEDEPFFLYLPHTMVHWPLAASDRFEGSSDAGTLGDAVREIDWSTGRILETLNELGIDEETLVIFTSDNGGARHHGASNDPLRGGKGSTWEGGQRVPCIMRWPGHIPAGEVCDEIATTMDFLPTFAHLAGTELPENRKIDGKNIWPLMSGKKGADSPYVAFYYYKKEHLRAVRSGPWKLRLKGNKLYNLDENIKENRDVSDRHPLVVRRLRALAKDARQDIGDGKQKGQNQRSPATVEDADPLTER